MIASITYSVCAIALLIVLFFSSKEDMKYHRISKKYVILTFLIVIVYTAIIGNSIEGTICFMLSLGLFSAFTFCSRGGFGFGDTLLIASLGWFIGDLIHLQYFYVTMGFCMLIIGSYFVLKNRKLNGKGWKNIFVKSILVPINEIKPGMILANDYFMKGLTEKEIEELKKRCDTSIMIKQAYPFIPVIFLSFLLYVIVYVAIF